MKTPLLIGNWKMQLGKKEAVSHIDFLSKNTEVFNGVEAVICPEFPLLYPLFERIKKLSLPLKLGAQNMSTDQSGAFTGEVSIKNLLDFTNYVVLGHSERRQLFGETSNAVAKKAILGTQFGLNVVVCIGENLEVMQEKQEEQFLKGQLLDSLFGFTKFENLVVAYEPIWAIGSGTPIDHKKGLQIQKMLRKIVDQISLGHKVPICYGGSVSSKTIRALYKEAMFDGFLVGGASLDPDQFCAMASVLSEG